MTCSKKAGFAICARVYELSSGNPHVSTELKTRLRAHAPVTNIPQETKVFTTLSAGHLRSNIVIKAAVNGDDGGLSLESMKFAVTFINQSGDEIVETQNIWIDGEMMASIISCSRKKIKFVFDETVHMKSGWRERTLLSQDPAR